MPGSFDTKIVEAEGTGRASDEEALRLVVAFYCIMEPERRAEVLELAERLAKQSQVVDGYTHFSLLNRDVVSDC